MQEFLRMKDFSEKEIRNLQKGLDEQKAETVKLQKFSKIYSVLESTKVSEDDQPNILDVLNGH